jgi:hypothetical protein
MQVDSPTMLQFVVLSMLLHLLVILLFGTAPGAGALRGEGWWGALNVTLRQLVPEAPPAPPPGPGPELTAIPQPQRRPAPPPSQPQPAPIEQPPKANPEAPQERARLSAPPAIQIEPIAPRPIEREIVPPVVLPRRELPVEPGVPVERIAPPKVEPEVAAPVELAPREMPIAPAAPIESLAPPRTEQPLAPPVELPAHEAPVVPAAPIERIAPRGIEQQLAPAAPPVAPIVAPPAPPAALPSAPAAAAPAPAQGAPAEELPRLRLGAPQRDEDMFKPRRDVVTPATEPGELPHIDRAASRERAREIAAGRAGPRALITLPVPAPPEVKSKEAKAIEKAGRPDCRTAYAGLLLLAVPFLVADTLTDSGCKW